MNAQTTDIVETEAAPAPDLSGASPVMQQFFEAKARQPDALVFFRMGDFYELFFDDAVKASGWRALASKNCAITGVAAARSTAKGAAGSVMAFIG